jgi:methylated-DNA-[protein]-cysteine S-methyltransferase
MEDSYLKTFCGNWHITLQDGCIQSIISSANYQQTKDSSLMSSVKTAIREILAGKRLSAEILALIQQSVANRGTPFQREVWLATLNVPFGQTRSYSEIAKQIGKPRASRAVGTALKMNPIPLLIPCHRVVRADGSVGEYNGGSQIKTALLKWEKHYYQQ